MPPWTTRWLGWARDNLFRRPRPRAADIGYERAGVTRWEAPVPWTADAAVVDVLLDLPPAARRKADFAFRLPFAAFPADTLRPDAGDRHRVTFRFPVPPGSVRGDLLWKGRVLATVAVPVLTPAVFLAGLHVAHASTSVRYGDCTASATAFVPDRCDTLIATIFLHAQSALAPVAELGLKATFHCDATGERFAVNVALSAAQLATTEALLTAVCPHPPRGVGEWQIMWTAGDHTLATQRLRAVAADVFEAGVRLLESRFAVMDHAGVVRAVRLPPPLASSDRIGPCFVVSGPEAGAAGVCPFELVGMTAGQPQPLLSRAAEVVVTDAATAFVPAYFHADELTGVSSFELWLNGRLLGVASLRPVPAATLNAEGGFIPPPEFVWSSAADDELTARLNQLK